MSEPADLCYLDYVRTRDDGKHVHKCSVCGREHTSKYADAAMKKVTCRAGQPEGGPGTELKTIFDTLGFTPKKSCGCAAIQRQMDRLGAAGVQARFKHYVSVLTERYTMTSTTERFAAAVAAITTGIAWRLDWADPIPSLLTLAIDRAKERQPHG